MKFERNDSQPYPRHEKQIILLLVSRYGNPLIKILDDWVSREAGARAPDNVHHHKERGGEYTQIDSEGAHKLEFPKMGGRRTLCIAHRARGNVGRRHGRTDAQSEPCL